MRLVLVFSRDGKEASLRRNNPMAYRSVIPHRNSCFVTKSSNYASHIKVSVDGGQAEK
jgi:hypothetical protein